MNMSINPGGKERVPQPTELVYSMSVGSGAYCKALIHATRAQA